MTIESYEQQLNELKNKHKKEITKLQYNFAIENKKYEIGDIIEDHKCKIKITFIKWYPAGYCFAKFPGVIYNGIELKKDNSPTKRQVHTSIYDANVKRKE